MKKIFFTTILSIFIIYSCAPSRISDDPNSNSDGLLLNVLGPIIATADRERARLLQEAERERIKNSIISMPTGLLRTGQTAVYQTWDDGTYQKGIARTFVVGGSTGLLWQRCSAGLNNDTTCSGYLQSYTWSQAISYCSSLSLGGKTWRLPTINELKSLVDYGKSSYPSIDTAVFPNTQSSYYWSSSSYAQNTFNAWFVDFFNGSMYYSSKTSYYWYVRCVTGP
jgi:hypothetical protein